MEPYLGFVHSEQFGKRSLVCDFMELFRYLVDDLVIQFCQGLNERDFTVKSEALSRRARKRKHQNPASEASPDNFFGYIFNLPTHTTTTGDSTNGRRRINRCEGNELII